MSAMLAGDLRHGQVGRQIAQHADLAVEQRLARRRGPVPGQQAQDLGPRLDQLD
jgi:ubiquinone biosynthesis protein UbiJ